MKNNIELQREIRELNNERVLQEKVLNAEKERFAEQLKGELGKDMMEVLSGKKVVKLSKKERFKFKINYWIKKILNAI